MQKFPYTISAESITVVCQGKPHTVRKGAANFDKLKKALVAEQWGKVPDLLSVAKTVQSWAKGKFKVEGDRVFYGGEAIPTDLDSRILAMAANGEDPTPLCRFWERLQKNPSYRSVKQLFQFLQNVGIPITEDGCFLAYKGVKEDFKDVHSGQFDNKPGAINEMPRNKISDDPQLACHEGFHVGDLSYAKGFGPRVVICKVDPEHVVCVPYDESQRKMRVCRYEVTGNYGVQLPDTSFKEKAAPGKKTLTEVLFASKLAKMPADKLLDCSLDSLRKYAANDLKIVGASKIPGGKMALIQAILKTRG